MNDTSPGQIDRQRNDDVSCEYSLVPILETPNIDPGSSIRITLFIVGTGTITGNQLFVGHEHPAIVGDNIGTLNTCFVHEDDHVITGEAAKDHGGAISKDLTSAGGHVSLRNEVFGEMDVEGARQLHFSLPYTGKRHDEIPPLQYELNTSIFASNGDYTIPIIFMYRGKNEEVQVERERVQVHVNSLRETLEPVPTIVAVLAALTTVGSVLYTALSVGGFL